MTVSKPVKIGLIVVVVAVAGYLAWRWYANRQSGDAGNGVAPGGSTNLNSVAPELIGGSSGPDVSPAVAMPISITLTDQGSSAPKPQVQSQGMHSGKRSAKPIHRQRHGAGMMHPDSGGTVKAERHPAAPEKKPVKKKMPKARTAGKGA
jgi:hypothetical protein